MTNEDLETLALLPDGVIYVDVLKGTAHHSDQKEVSLEVVRETRNWLQLQSIKEDIDYSEIKKAELWISIDTTQPKTNKKYLISFNFTARSRIATDEAEYKAEVGLIHRWHHGIST